MVRGEFKNKERVTAPRILGGHIDQETGKETRTNKLMIKYSKAGSYIYPRKENDND